MKKTVACAMSLCMLLSLHAPLVKANETRSSQTTGNDLVCTTSNLDTTNYQPTDFTLDQDKVVDQHLYPGNLQRIELQIDVAKEGGININDYSLTLTTSDDSIFTKESLENFGINYTYSCGEKQNNVNSTFLYPQKAGEVTLNLTLTNVEDSNEVYYARRTYTFEDTHAGEKLVINKTEISGGRDQLLAFHTNDGALINDTDAIVDEFQVGFLQKDGSILYDDIINVSTSDPAIANAGRANSEVNFNTSAPNYAQYLSPYISKYFSNDEVQEAILREENDENNCLKYGSASGPGVYAIYPRNAGTADITFSYGTQSVTIKVNVSNLTNFTLDEIPNDFVGEFSNPENKSLELNLRTSDIVDDLIFQAAKDTNKDVTFNIVDKNGKNIYSWLFEANDITNINMNFDLGINFLSNKEDAIRKLVNQENMMFLSFNHSGTMPGKALVSVDVSNTYKDGDTVVLNYYNEAKNAIEKMGEYIVKDGYISFTLDHCSEYFLTKPGSTDAKVDPVDPANPDQTNKDNPNTTGSKDNPMKDLSSSLHETTYISIAYLLITASVIGFGIMLVLNKKKALKRK